jgi:ABC-type transport system substrate-binding protein
MKTTTPLRRALAVALLGLLPGVVCAQTLRFVQGTDLDTLDPAITRSTPSHIVVTHIFNRLVDWDGPAMQKIVPDLAESWTLADDKKTWTFKLRRNVKFHDGTPFNSAAVKVSLDRIRDAALGSPNRSYYALIESIATPADDVVVITTSQPMPTLLEVLAEEWSSINSPTAIAKSGRAYGRNPVGTGPYVFKSWVQGEKVVLERNPAYFGTPGKPQALEFRPVPEPSARVIELQTGNADVVTHIPPESAEEIRRGGKADLHVVPSSFQVFFELNTAKPPFNDVRMRRAVNLAIDRKAIVEKVLNGYGKVPESPMPAGVQGRRAFGPYPFDPAQARKLIREAFPNGYNEPIVMWTSSGRYVKDKAVAEAVQGYLNDVGLKTEFKVWEWATYQKTLYAQKPGQGTGRGSNDAHMWLLGTGITNADTRLRRKLVQADSSNLTGYTHPQIEVLLKDASSDMNYETRMAKYGDVQKIVWNESPYSIPLFDQVQLVGTRKGLSGLSIHPDEIIELTGASAK